MALLYNNSLKESVSTKLEKENVRIDHMCIRYKDLVNDNLYFRLTILDCC